MSTFSHGRVFGLSLAGFFVFGAITAFVIPWCYAEAQSTASAAGGENWYGDVMKNGFLQAATTDRSAASVACVAAIFYVIARCSLLRERLGRQSDAVKEATRFMSQGAAAVRLSGLAFADPVRTYLEGALARLRGDEPAADSGLELLERRMERTHDLSAAITLLVTLGLIGTLLGLYIGFQLTPGAGASSGAPGDELHKVLQQAVIAVATACLSSVVGIGLGLFVATPLGNDLRNRSDELMDGALAIEQLISARTPPSGRVS